MKIGDKVGHILTNEWLLVIDVKDDKVICRRKNLELVALRPWEIKLVE